MTMILPDSSTPGETQESTSSPPTNKNIRSDRFAGKSEASRKEINKLIDWCNRQFTACKQERSAFERQWHLNYAFYMGRQNVTFRGQDSLFNRNFQLYTPPAPYYRSRPIINKIRPIARREMARLTSQKPSVSVVPQSSDDRDLFAAQSAEQVWEYIYSTQNIGRLMRRSVFWTVIAGVGFIKCWWDDNEPDPVAQTMGKICYEPITPFHLFAPDLKCEEIEYQPFILHAQLMNADVLSAKFGQEINYESGRGLEDNYATMLGVQQWAQDKTCLAMEFWVKPGQFPQMLPDGGMVTVAANNLINVIEGMPYTHGLYPFAKVGDVHTGQFYSDSVVKDLIPLQREYNRTRGQIIESKNRMAKPQMAVEEGSVDPNKLTSEPGLIIEYTPGFHAPQLLQPAQLPTYVENELMRIIQDMDDISGQHDVSRGQAPSGVTAATAISYLQEADDTMLSYTYDAVEEGIEKIANLTLAYVHDYWTDERMIKVTGVDETFDDFAFKGSDIPSGADIRVEGGSALPTSKAAKQAFIMDLMSKGFIPPDKGLEVLEIGGVEKLYEQYRIDQRQAQRENLKMRNVTEFMIEQHEQFGIQQILQQNQGDPNIVQDEDGQIWDYTATNESQQQGQDPPLPPEPLNPPLIVPVNTWDNHQVHIQVHNDYRKSQSFENIPDDVKNLFEQHVQGHMQALSGAYNQQMSGALAPPVAGSSDPNNPDGNNQFSGVEQDQGEFSQPADTQPQSFGDMNEPT